MTSHEPTLIAAARSQMTASFPRGTFSRAELAGELVTRRIWCDEFGGRVSSFECGRQSEPAAATKMARRSSQGVPGGRM